MTDRLDPYHQLVVLSEAACVLASSQRWDEFADAQAEMAEVFVGLPTPHPAAAQPLLERAQGLHAQVTGVLQAQRAEIVTGLAEVRSERRAAAGYLADHGPDVRSNVDHAA